MSMSKLDTLETDRPSHYRAPIMPEEFLHPAPDTVQIALVINDAISSSQEMKLPIPSISNPLAEIPSPTTKNQIALPVMAATLEISLVPQQQEVLLNQNQPSPQVRDLILESKLNRGAELRVLNDQPILKQHSGTELEIVEAVCCFLLFFL